MVGDSDHDVEQLRDMLETVLSSTEESIAATQQVMAALEDQNPTGYGVLEADSAVVADFLYRVNTCRWTGSASVDQLPRSVPTAEAGPPIAIGLRVPPTGLRPRRYNA